MSASEQSAAAAAPTDPLALRQRAEARLPPEGIAGLAPEAARQLLHELQVHQIELEMQNEELRESEVEQERMRARYFDLYDLAPVGYCALSEQSLIKQANLGAASLLGVARGALIGQPLTSFIHKDDQNSYYLHRKKLVESGEQQSFELRLVKKDGRQVWVQVAVSIASDADGALELRAVLSDVTARKLAEDALRSSEERYHDLFNLIDEGFCVIDVIFNASGRAVDYRFLEVNPGFERHTGMDAVVGKRITEMVPNIEAHWFATYGRVALTGEPIRFMAQARDMQERWFDLYAFRIGGRDSRKVAVLFRNETERKRLESGLNAARHAADQANLAKSEFLSSMSHELRTPLTAILGFAQLMESATPPPSAHQQANLEQILKAGWHLLQLIDEILDLAAVESGRVSLSIETIVLEEVWRECESIVAVQAGLHGVGVTFAAIGDRLVIAADRTRVKQVIINLVSNAIKYNRPGGTVNVTCAPGSGDSLRISVRDTGIGMAPEQLAQLFQPFNRLGQQAGAVQGTGIGLVVTRQLVELMGGSIGVESSVGQGSLFWVEFSVAAAPLTAAPRAAAEPGAVPPATRSSSVLYVEDNPANLLLVQSILERRPAIRLLSARDGLSGVALARSARPDLILMDIDLPDISGIEARLLLAADPDTAHIPVIALSANAMLHDIEKARAAGFFHYLTKPVKVAELLATLDAALESVPVPAARVAPPEQS